MISSFPRLLINSSFVCWIISEAWLPNCPIIIWRAWSGNCIILKYKEYLSELHMNAARVMESSMSFSVWFLLNWLPKAECSVVNGMNQLPSSRKKGKCFRCTKVECITSAPSCCSSLNSSIFFPKELFDNIFCHSGFISFPRSSGLISFKFIFWLILGPSLIISGMISSCSLRVIFSVSRARIKRRVIVRIAASRSAICGYSAVRFL